MRAEPSLLTHLVSHCKGLLLAAAAVSAVRGVCSVFLIAQINMALTTPSARGLPMAWWFAATALAVMLSTLGASVLFERLSQRALADLRRHICDWVMAADLRKLEQAGSARVQSALAEHSANVAQFFVSMPAILTNGIIVAGCLIYMALLSWQVLAAALVVIGLGSLGYHWAHLRAIVHLNRAAREQDQLFEHFRALTEGAKELRLNRRKQAAFADGVLGQAIDSVRRERTLGMSIFIASTSWGNFLIYAFIGLVLFVLVGDVPDRTRVMTGFALVIVYIAAPLEILLLNLPRANLARASADRIEALARALQGAPEIAAPPAAPPAVHGLSLQGVRHRYYHEQSDDFFELGPIDLAFRPGEIVFLVGGNGSGKTTLAKLIVGLYAPESGQVRLNGEPVDDAGRDRYRQAFSAIFSDFHLFDRLLQTDRPDLDEAGNRLLEKLHLQHKVQVRAGAFTTRALSQGQRKRLALVAACLEDRPFLVFDEWAADQDPVFKDVFYRKLLPELKSQGKIVLVISHDDRYFNLADRLIRMENGRIDTAAGGDELVQQPRLRPAEAA
jgi:putative ATP-binding cassette transporter